MSTHKNDPRRGNAEGRKKARKTNGAPTSVVDLHYDDQCALCADLAEQMVESVRIDAPVSVRLGIKCNHQVRPLADVDCAECIEKYHRALDDNPLARALAEWADGPVMHITGCDHDRGDS